MPKELLNMTEMAEIVGVTRTYFRKWQADEKQERFRRVVKERERNQFNRREVQRWLDGAEY